MSEFEPEKKIYLAAPRGFCAGVHRALACVDAVLTQNQAGKVYVYHEIVHNVKVVESLKQRGVVFVNSPEAIPEGGIVIFSAHGVDPVIEQRCLERKLTIIDASCPLVKRIHHKALSWARQNAMVCLIGHAGHPETQGTLGYAGKYGYLISTIEDVENLTIPRECSMVGYLTQTTIGEDELLPLIERLKEKIPQIQGDGDICYATHNRQQAVRQLCAICEMIIIIGSKKSSNSNRLWEIAVRDGKKAYLIDSYEEIAQLDYSQYTRIGISAGASAPEYLVEECMEFLRGRGFGQSEEICCAQENLSFKLPRIPINSQG